MKRRSDRYQKLLALAPDEGSRGALSLLIVNVGIPPDLSFLIDGLERTRRILTADVEAFDQLLEGAGVKEEGTKVWLGWIELGLDLGRQLIEGPDDPMERQMGRLRTSDPHPLYKFCLTICPHWSNLFYEWPGNVQGDKEIYEKLLEWGSRYILVAQRITRRREFLECYSSRQKMSESHSYLIEEKPAARIDAAARSLRRLADPALAEYIRWFEGDPGNLAELCDAVEGRLASSADNSSFRSSENDRHFRVVVCDLRRLDELVRGNAEKRQAIQTGFRSKARVVSLDGYVRIIGGQLAIAEEELDGGGTLLRVFHDPNTARSTFGQKPKPGPPPLDTADQLGISVLELDDEDHGTERHRRLQSERQAKLLARFSTAPNLDRLSLDAWQSKRIMDNLGGVELPVRAFLIAHLATGRDLAEQALPIFTAMPQEVPEIAFLLDECPSWILRVDPPAWHDHPVSEVERHTVRVLRLPDVLGFSECLSRPPQVPQLMA